MIRSRRSGEESPVRSLANSVTINVYGVLFIKLRWYISIYGGADPGTDWKHRNHDLKQSFKAEKVFFFFLPGNQLCSIAAKFD